MTLDEMIQQCAGDIDEILTLVDGEYQGDELVIATKIVAGINYAYQKIAREKLVLTTEETVTLGENGSFALSSLSKPVVRMRNVLGQKAGGPIDWELRNQATVICPYMDEGATVTAQYAYLPPRLLIAELDSEPLLPEGRVDHMVLCYYADFYVLSLEPDNESREKSATFLGLFNNGFDEIQIESFEDFTIGIGDFYRRC